MWDFKISPPWDSNEGYISKCVIMTWISNDNMTLFFIYSFFENHTKVHENMCLSSVEWYKPASRARVGQWKRYIKRYLPFQQTWLLQLQLVRACLGLFGHTGDYHVLAVGQTSRNYRPIDKYEDPSGSVEQCDTYSSFVSPFWIKLKWIE